MRGSTVSLSPPKERGGLVAFLPALAVAAFTAACGMAALYAPPATGEMGVVFPPWVDRGAAIRAIVAAGGAFANGSRLPNVLVAVATDPGFAERVRSNGAWFTVAATGLCGDDGIQNGGVS